jgi:hypothetical protein
MMRTVLAAASVVAITCAASGAAAQATGTPNQPPPEQPAPPQASAAPAPGMARVHFRTYRGRERAEVFVRTVQGNYALVCTSPCTADLPPGAELRVMLGDSEDSHVFNVPQDLGSEVDVEVRAPGKGGLVGGIIMVSIGGIFAIAGIALTALSTEERSGSRTGTLTGGLVCLGLGVGLGLPGILLMANRSREPRVRETPHRDRPGRYGRSETLLGDVAEGRPGDRGRDTGTVPVAVTPFQLGFAF